MLKIVMERILRVLLVPGTILIPVFLFVLIKNWNSYTLDGFIFCLLYLLFIFITYYIVTGKLNPYSVFKKKTVRTNNVFLLGGVLCVILC